MTTLAGTAARTPTGHISPDPKFHQTQPECSGQHRQHPLSHPQPSAHRLILGTMLLWGAGKGNGGALHSNPAHTRAGAPGGTGVCRGGRGCWGLQLWGSCQLLPGLELLEPLESPAAPRSPRTPRSLAPRQPGKGFVSFQAGRGEFQWSPHKNSLWGEPAPGRGGGMRRDDLSDDFIPLSAPKIHGNLIRKGLKIQREGRGQHPLPLPKMSPWGRCMQASRSHAGATRAPGLFRRGVHGGDNQ